MSVRLFVLASIAIVMGGSVASGKHPSVFLHDIISSPQDLFAADPNDSIPAPPPAPTGLAGSARTSHNFGFYDRLTKAYMRSGGLESGCGRITKIPNARAYIADLAEGSTPVRGEHWEGVITNAATVATVAVAPGDHPKLLYLRATNRIIWNVEGAPSAIFLYGHSYLGNAPEGVPVFSLRHARNCPSDNGLPKDIRQMKDDMLMAAAFGQMRPGQSTIDGLKAGVKMGQSLHEQAALINGRIVEMTSGAEIGKQVVKQRGRRIAF